MYLDDDKTVFTTLCVGDQHYKDALATQMQSILKFTHHELYVVTDTPNFWGNYYGNRVHFLNLTDLTDMPLKGKLGMFNYNLKMIPIKWVLDNIKPTIAIYMDCDSFLFGWDRLFYRFFPQDKEGIWGRFRHALNDSAAHKLILDKLTVLNIDATNIVTRLPVENVMFFKPGAIMPRFFQEWERLARLTYDMGARTDFEAIEMALAIHRTELPYHHMDNKDPYVDNFRTQHHGRIHIPFVL